MREYVKEWLAGEPPARASRSKYAAYAEELREKPGLWALMGSLDDGENCAALREGLRKQGCEVAWRYPDLYARWPA